VTPSRPGDVSRRAVLRLGAAGGAALTATVAGARTAFAAGPPGDTLVVVSLRGGADGLTLVPPVGDPGYAAARPTLAVPASAVHRAGGVFGLHPALAPLFPLWDGGKLAAVHAVGPAQPTHSHREAVTALERGAATATTGWVDRAVGAIGDRGAYAATQLGDPGLPQALAGPRPAFALGGLDAATIAVSDNIVPVQGWQDALGMLQRGAPAHLVEPVVPALAAAAQLSALAPTASAGESGYPPTPLGQALHDVARLVKARVGLRVVTVDDQGWDLHAAAGTATRGAAATRIGRLAGALAAFARELGPDLGSVVVVVLSEFGRRVAENGSGGTDHGHGGAMLVLGGGVTGGKVYGRWPGLGADALVEGDLAVTTDTRQVLAEILARRCAVRTPGTVFPGVAAAAPLGIVKPR
jgi:uncharacterized protein (DUF1501 family)